MELKLLVSLRCMENYVHHDQDSIPAFVRSDRSKWFSFCNDAPMIRSGRNDLNI